MYIFANMCIYKHIYIYIYTIATAHSAGLVLPGQG